MTIQPIKVISTTLNSIAPVKKTSAIVINTTQKLAKDTFELKIPRKTINLLSKSFDEITKSLNFAFFEKEGIPLKYPREKFITKIKNIEKNIPLNKKAEFLNKFNLKLGINDIDGIPIIKNPTTKNQSELKMIKLINRFYNNKAISQDKKLNKTINSIIKDFPEFTMLIGKPQHETHKYSMDIHTLEVLSKSLKNPLYQTLSDEGKNILKLSALMHDYGKNGNVITHNHPANSKNIAEKLLEKYSISNESQKRILNHINNHHWFAEYNKGIINAENFSKKFPKEEDRKIAVILAKSDFESINDNFHLFMLTNEVLSQKQYEKIINSKMSNLLQKTIKIN